jgi:hypothetical protein
MYTDPCIDEFFFEVENKGEEPNKDYVYADSEEEQVEVVEGSN